MVSSKTKHEEKSKIHNPKSKIEMPSGKTHDAVTFLFVAPTLAAAWSVSGSIPLALIVGFGFLFGGLMFGPDLDTVSKQYSRWSIFRLLWYPYQVFFKHRSRWSHGLIFGTFLARHLFYRRVDAFEFSVFLRLYVGFGRRNSFAFGICKIVAENRRFRPRRIWRIRFFVFIYRLMARRGKSHTNRYGWLIHQTRAHYGISLKGKKVKKGKGEKVIFVIFNI